MEGLEMSKVIPQDEPLTLENRRHLRFQGAYGDALEQRLDGLFPPDPAELASFEIEMRKEHAAINGTGLNESDTNALADENTRLRAELAALRAAAAADAPPAAPVAGDYTGAAWTKAALEAEIDRVNAEDEEIVAGDKPALSKGTKADMAAALTAYFADAE